jgi:hypothetical protein
MHQPYILVVGQGTRCCFRFVWIFSTSTDDADSTVCTGLAVSTVLLYNHTCYSRFTVGLGDGSNPSTHNS